MLVSFKKTVLFLAVVVSLAAFAAPGYAALSADDFRALCRTGTPQEVEAAIKAVCQSLFSALTLAPAFLAASTC
jgi:hypothetical protein